MKRFIIAACAAVALGFLAYTAYYQFGVYLDLRPDVPVESFMTVEGKTIYMEKDGVRTPFEIRGVDLGAGVPGHWATDYAVDKETYLRWFRQIQELGANTIRVYITLHDDFYNAFYEYNKDREEPLYLIHGVWINDYMFFSHRDAYDEDLLDALLKDCRTVVDVIHGQRTLSLGRGTGSGSYRKDISPWVIGYIIGVEWESSLVAYTNQKSEQLRAYEGEYLYTSPEASAFEAMLCQAGDSIIAHESRRYKQQRLVAFSNWPTTDPFVYPVAVISHRNKVACVNTEHIKGTDAFSSGMFASYHIYPYFPDYLEIMAEAGQYSQEEIDSRIGEVIRATLEYRSSLMDAPAIEDYIYDSDYYDRQGRYNTYLAYLRAINRYHSMPVVISEYGVTTGRGMAQQDVNTGRNQGHMTEQEQGKAVVECYQDIMDAGCAGSCLFIWQDEWFKRTWNTMHAVDLSSTAYWSDYQTNEQFFGLLTFEPGKEESVCCVDGDPSEWTPEDLVLSREDLELSMKYDEKFLYFLVKKPGFQWEEDTLYIPIDTTPKSGSTYCQEYGVSFERASDFLIVLHGREDSRVLVQQRYEALLSTYSKVYYLYDAYITPPEADSPHFQRIYLPLTLGGLLPLPGTKEVTGTKYETGLLRYGIADPASEAFDSLADFCFGGDCVEIRLPWQLLNFSDPSNMLVHDDYYEHYGIENLRINRLYAGAGTGREGRIRMEPVPLRGWGRHPESHERLKQSYYILQEYWASLDQMDPA